MEPPRERPPACACWETAVAPATALFPAATSGPTLVVDNRTKDEREKDNRVLAEICKDDATRLLRQLSPQSVIAPPAQEARPPAGDHVVGQEQATPLALTRAMRLS